MFHRMRYAHTDKTHTHTHTHLDARMCQWTHVNRAGFNKRVGVARWHPIIIVIVDTSGAANHGGQDLISELHAAPIQHTASF